MNLHDVKLHFDINEVYEYYFMAFLHRTDNWLFNNFDELLNEIGGYHRQLNLYVKEIYR
jgi:hypothetical protein